MIKWAQDPIFLVCKWIMPSKSVPGYRVSLSTGICHTVSTCSNRQSNNIRTAWRFSVASNNILGPSQISQIVLIGNNGVGGN